MSVAPIPCIGVNQLWLLCSEPPNMRCSNRWAKPVRPGGSSLEPIEYQMLTATTGALWSSWTTTRRPLGRVNSWCGMLTCATRLRIELAGGACAGGAAGGGGGRGGDGEAGEKTGGHGQGV